MTIATDFDATIWLQQFRDVGGTFLRQAAGGWIIGWHLDRELNDDDACALHNQVRDRPDRIEAVKLVAALLEAH